MAFAGDNTSKKFFFLLVNNTSKKLKSKSQYNRIGSFGNVNELNKTTTLSFYVAELRKTIRVIIQVNDNVLDRNATKGE